VTDDTADDDGDGMTNKYERDYGVLDGGWQNPFIYNERYAILITGSDNLDLFKIDHKNTYNQLLKDLHFKTENIYNHYYNLDSSDYVGGPITGPAAWSDASLKNERTNEITITESLSDISSKITSNDFIFIFLNTHGTTSDGKVGSWEIPLYNEFNVDKLLYSDLLIEFKEQFYKNGNLNKPKIARGLVWNTACYSEDMLIQAGTNYHDCPLKNFIIIGEARHDQESFGSDIWGGYFGSGIFGKKGFIRTLIQGHSIMDSFSDGIECVRNSGKNQEPVIEDDWKENYYDTCRSPEVYQQKHYGYHAWSLLSGHNDGGDWNDPNWQYVYTIDTTKDGYIASKTYL